MIKYLIVENEMLARKELSRNISKLRPHWEYAGYGETVDEVVRLLNENKDINLVFMDIELDDGQCFEIFDRIDTDVSIIFTTAYSEYALQAFHLNSLDYLLKPFSLDSLENSIKKYERFYDKISNQYEDDGRLPIQKNFTSDDTVKKSGVPRILIQQGDKYSFLPIERIAWFECEDKYVFCVDVNGHKWMSNFKSLRDFEECLPEETFCKLRRNVVASISSVESVHKFVKGSLRVCLCAGDKEETVIVPQPNKNNVLEWLGMH